MLLDARDRTRLNDMILHARDAIDLLGTRTVDEMYADLGVRHGIVRCVEVIGEAGHQITRETQSLITTIPWHLMWAMRNRLIHDYGNTNYAVVYRVVREELPQLVETLETFLNETES